MSAQELLMEQFHREVCVQEQAQLRKRLVIKFETELGELKQKLRDQELLHEKEKIALRWQQDDQVRRSPSPTPDRCAHALEIVSSVSRRTSLGVVALWYSLVGPK